MFKLWCLAEQAPRSRRDTAEIAYGVFEPWRLGRWTRPSEPMPLWFGGFATLTGCLAYQDLLRADNAYELRDTGQGLHRVQPAPRTSRAMQQLLHLTQARSRRDDAEIARGGR